MHTSTRYGIKGNQERSEKYLKKCPYCQTSYSEIMQTGFVGCQHCYKEIPELKEALIRLYGQRKHKGRGGYGSV